VVILVAGRIWIIFGCLILINAVINLMLSMSLGTPVGGLCSGVMGALFAAVFIHVGRQSIAGTARGAWKTASAPSASGS
jgi:hypothetical protein